MSFKLEEDISIACPILAISFNSESSTFPSDKATDNADKILFSGDYTKVEGNGAMGYDFNSGYRISEAYAKLAKEFAKNLKKKGLK